MRNLSYCLYCDFIIDQELVESSLFYAEPLWADME